MNIKQEKKEKKSKQAKHSNFKRSYSTLAGLPTNNIPIGLPTNNKKKNKKSVVFFFFTV